MTVTDGRTVYELRGIPCLALEMMEPTRKGIAVIRAAEKMRGYKVAAENIFVFMHMNTFNKDPFYSNGASA